MADMCSYPGCPDLACFIATIDGCRIPFCLQHGKIAQERVGQVEEKLAEHAYGTRCILDGCERCATHQTWFGGHWYNQCEPHARHAAKIIGIMRREPEGRFIRPLQIAFRKPPQVRIEEVPVG